MVKITQFSQTREFTVFEGTPNQFAITLRPMTVAEQNAMSDKQAELMSISQTRTNGKSRDQRAKELKQQMTMRGGLTSLQDEYVVRCIVQWELENEDGTPYPIGLSQFRTLPAVIGDAITECWEVMNENPLDEGFLGRTEAGSEE